MAHPTNSAQAPDHLRHGHERAHGEEAAAASNEKASEGRQGLAAHRRDFPPETRASIAP